MAATSKNEDPQQKTSSAKMTSDCSQGPGLGVRVGALGAGGRGRGARGPGGGTFLLALLSIADRGRHCLLKLDWTEVDEAPEAAGGADGSRFQHATMGT